MKQDGIKSEKEQATLYATLTNKYWEAKKRSAACRSLEAREEAGEKYPGERVVVPKLGRAGNYNFPSSWRI